MAENTLSIKTFVNNITNNELADAADDFTAIMGIKVADAIEVRKKEVALSLFNTKEQ